MENSGTKCAIVGGGLVRLCVVNPHFNVGTVIIALRRIKLFGPFYLIFVRKVGNLFFE